MRSGVYPGLPDPESVFRVAASSLYLYQSSTDPLKGNSLGNLKREASSVNINLTPLSSKMLQVTWQEIGDRRRS
ncbi:uncharacterized protein ARMOST_18487 [Armillaria ostoyae]|uniref:Uncharacterized protein n=1 Tax=Armillaria ostoyae TaxID=47428 RepID=A0A284S1Y2_ARMOS|nr:uncharacterized protein ARMOST_18487 [Armillaria ostoyae]